MPNHSLLICLCLLINLTPFACSPAEPQDASSFGKVTLPLVTQTNGRTLRLENAAFQISGDAEWLLHSADRADGEALTQALPAGQYTIELLDGWSLSDLSDAGSQPLSASLESLNPVPFAIKAGKATQVVFRFAAHVSAAAEQGSLAVELAVTWRTAQSVFFSEIMKDPQSVPDAQGEWFELSNAGEEAFTLTGCSVSRDGQSFAIASETVMAPGTAAVFANSMQPGFTPNVVYSGLTLPNSTDFLLQLSCGGELVDEVSVIAAAFPNRSGASLSLSSARWSAEQNDDGAGWCTSTSKYSEDFGTPGILNPSCDHAGP